MRFVNKKTTELSVLEKEEICTCYAEVFEGHVKPLLDFDSQYLNTCLGYSFHTLLTTDEDEIVGQYVVVPFKYFYKGQNMLFSFGADFMIRKDHRNDFKNVMGLCGESLKYSKANGVKCIFAFPNDLSYLLNLRVLRMKEVGKLHTYILPYKVGDAKPALTRLNIFSKLFCVMMLWFSKFDGRSQHSETLIHRDRSSFNDTRYKWFNPEEYKLVEEKDFTCSWKCTDFDGVKAAFLMDVYPLSAKNFNQAVRKMFDAEKNNVGLFLYVGELSFNPISMIKIPLKYAPKNFNFVAQILDRKEVSADDVFNINNWDVNLSSYDLL